MNASHLVANYACSVCYGPLIQDVSGAVVCAKYRGDHQGYVSQWFVRHYREKSDLVFAEARNFYADTKWAKALGIHPKLHGAALQRKLNHNRHSLGRDDSLF